MVCLVGGDEKKYLKRKIDDLYQQSLNQMIKNAECSAGHLHKITKTSLGKEERTHLEERKRRCQAAGPL